MALADIPGYGAYTQRRAQNEQESASNLQQAQGAMGILAAMQKQNDDQQLSAAMAASGGDPEKAMQIALQQGNFAAAHQIAPLVETKRKEKERQVLAGGDMNDPEFMRRAGVALQRPEFITHAERIEKKRQDSATLQAMQTGPSKMIPPDPQEVSQASDSGMAAPQAATVPGRAGMFADLSKSEIPHIATAAQNLQAQVDRSANVSPDYWQKQHEALQAREGQYMQQKALLAQKQGAPEAIVPPQHADKHGPEFLATLPIADQQLVKGVAEYRINPATLSNKGGHRERVLALAAQTNPEYDQTQYASRAGVRKDFTSGKTSGNVTAINTAIGHIGTLDELGDALNSGDIKAVNRVVNSISSQFNNPALNNVKIAQSAVGDELMRVFRQVGASKEESDAWKAKFDAANTPAERKGAVKTAGELLRSRIDALNDQWDRGMGSKGGYKDLLSPKSQAVMGKVSKYGAPQSAPGSNPAVDALLEKYK